MSDEARRRDKLIGLFVVGMVLFDPPILNLFSGPTLFGWPLLYVYVFLAWAFLIAAIAVIAERRGGRNPDKPETEDR